MLTIRVHGKPAYVLITAFGAIDITTVGRLRDRLFGLASDGRPLVVDLDHVSLADAAGLGVLVGAAHRAAAYGTRLYVACTQQETLRQFESTGLDRQIRLVRTLDEAVHDLMAVPMHTQARTHPAPAGTQADLSEQAGAKFWPG